MGTCPYKGFIDRLHIDNFSVIPNNSSIGGSSSSHYHPTNLNSLGHGICVHKENTSAAEGLEPGTPGL